jgi:pyruvate dehydrogenase E1 component alpha subunit
MPEVKASSIDWIADRAAGYRIPGIKVPENDAVQVWQAAAPAIARARRGDGPSLIEVKTDRYFGHFQGDPEMYRPKDEVANLKKTDPIPRLAQMLLQENLITAKEQSEIDQKMRRLVDEAFEFARKSDYPKVSDALHDVFVNDYKSGRALV